MISSILIPALLASSAFAGPVRRQNDPDVVVDVVTDIVYVTAGGSEPISTSRCTEEPASATPPSVTPGSAASSAPITTADASSTSASIPYPAGNTTSFANIIPTGTPGQPPCEKPLTVGMDGQPILIGLGGLTLGACSYTATVTENPLTFLTGADAVTATDSTARFPSFGTAITSSPVTSTVSATGEDGSVSASTTITSASIRPLFTTPSAFASQSTTLTKVTAAPTFGAVLTDISVLATASVSLPPAQSSPPGY